MVKNKFSYICQFRWQFLLIGVISSHQSKTFFSFHNAEWHCKLSMKPFFYVRYNCVESLWFIFPMQWTIKSKIKCVHLNLQFLLKWQSIDAKGLLQIDSTPPPICLNLFIIFVFKVDYKINIVKNRVDSQLSNLFSWLKVIISQ